MKSEQEAKSKLKKPRFRKRAIEKLLIRLLVELKIADLDLVEKLTYSLVDVISDCLEGQRFSNDDIISIFKTNKATQDDLIIVRDIPASLIHSNDLKRWDLDVKIGYIPKGLTINNDVLFRLVDLTAKRIQSDFDFMKSLYYILSHLLGIKDIAIHLKSKWGETYYTNGVFKNSQALWQAFIK